MRKYTGNTRKEELEKITKCYYSLRNLSIALLGLCLAALVLALLKRMLPSVVCLGLMLILRVTAHKKARTAFSQGLIDSALACSVGPRLDQFELFTKGGAGITPENILEAQLLPIREGVKSNICFYQGLSGTLRDMEVSMSDTTLQLRALPAKKGIPIVVGVWMRILLPKDTGRNFRVLSKELLPPDYRREFFQSFPALAERDAQEAGLSEKLCLYDAAAADDAPAFTSTFTSAANRLFKKTSGRTALSVQGNTVNVFIKSRLLAPHYNLNTKPDESFLKADPVPEFRDVLELVKGL